MDLNHSHLEEQASLPYRSFEYVKMKLAKWNPSISREKWEVLSIEPVTWHNSSLECPMPGKYYLQVLTPGYLIWMKGDHQIVEVHTDLSFRTVGIPGVGFL